MPDSTKRRILITGAGGRIGRMLANDFADTYEVARHYRNIPADVAPEGAFTADITSLESVLPITEGIDTVLHMAADPSQWSTWESSYTNNIGGTYNVLEAAKRSGVRRIIFASTNHVMGMNDEKGDWPVYNNQLQRPDGYYGASKAFGEILGRFYWDLWGLEFISLRIGWYAEDPSSFNSDVGRGMWLSPRDCAQIFRLAIETREQFGIFYAISDNPNRRWDITDATLKLGYRPQDSWTRTLGIDEDLDPTKPLPNDWPTPPRLPNWPEEMPPRKKPSTHTPV